jgi:hypothetical protein
LLSAGFAAIIYLLFLNGPNGFATSYDIGGAVEWEIGSWDITAMGMNVGETMTATTLTFLPSRPIYST